MTYFLSLTQSKVQKMKITGYAAQSAQSGMAPFSFERRALRRDDVSIDILYCGVCHSDLHQTRGDWEWAQTIYPCVPGHEIVGKVAAVGEGVNAYQVGDLVAVGCLVDSCGHCDQCQAHEETLCREGVTVTYNGQDRIDGQPTFGGYSKTIVVRESFVLRVPTSLDTGRVAPLLCAGITCYTPLRATNVGPGTRVGVIGLGGLGHMGVKLARGMGAKVTMISRSADKAADAAELGAEAFLLSSNPESMAAAANAFDVIIDTIPVKHDLSPYIPLLDINGTLVIVGQIGPMEAFNSAPVLFGRRKITGSPVGGIAQTQEMLDFCAEKNILPECETIAIQQINEAFERMERADVRYRFVIDMASLEGTAA